MALVSYAMIVIDPFKVTNNYLTTIRESESYAEQLTNQLEMARYAY